MLQEAIMNQPLSKDQLQAMDAYWRAANYLSVEQIYLLDNPLLREPLRLEHIKPRLLGHWATTPGLNFIYVHLNRIIKEQDLNMIYIAGPGHGGPGLVANTYLEGTYSEVYSNISPDVEGLRKLFKQFSFPGGIPSHVAPETPGSIHEGVNSDTPWRTRTEPRSTTQTSSSPVSWVTGKPKRAPWRRHGTRTNF
jgi:xylulose-5-phosphate/fructose-6-phosphate phosphoketolase